MRNFDLCLVNLEQKNLHFNNKVLQNVVVGLQTHIT